MNLTDQIYAQALVMVGSLSPEQDALLRVLCQAAKATLASRLRAGVTPEDCRADFVSAGSLFALAALNRVREGDAPDQITAGDLTIRKNAASDPASAVLRNQAELMIAPYLKDRFSFQGV